MSLIFRVKLILVHRYTPVWITSLAVLFVLSSINSGWFMDDYWHRLGYSNVPAVNSILKENERLKGPMHAYSFLTGDVEQITRAQEHGFFPWWMDTSVTVCFWRPVTGLLLDLDYTFWPNNAAYMHIHSILWFAGLVFIAVILFRNIMGATWAAGLAALLFAIDDSHAGPVAFLANRHTLLAVFWGVITLWSFDHWRKSGLWRWGGFSCLAFLIGLLSSEGGIAIIAFLLSYLLFLDAKPLSQKWAALLPYSVLILGWRLLYNYLGYGAIGNELYVDPIREPWFFVLCAIERVPILLLGLTGYPPSQLYIAFSNQAVRVYCLAAYGILIVLGLLSYPFWKDCKISRFWLAGMILAVIPLCSALPGNRNMGIAALGASGFMAQVFSNFLSERFILMPVRIQRGLYWIGIVVGAFLNLVLYPLELLTTPTLLKNLQQQFVKSTIFPGWDSSIEQKDIVVVNSPMGLFGSVSQGLRLLDNLPIPAHTWVLSPELEPYRFLYLDEKTCIISRDYGFLPPADSRYRSTSSLFNHIGFTNVLRRFNRLIVNRKTRFPLGEQHHLQGVTITVNSVTDDGRPKEIQYSFSRNLNDQSLLWYTWNKKTFRFEHFPLPEMGKEIWIE